ncbi:MAG: hypothetical protein E4G99_02625 [Anaerolineales bacterium]|nr:MAG: hypothetical protein E4G99_02625 [Anaerolineales bacterium]
MSITRQHLIDLARQETLQRADRGAVVSGYLMGSVASGDPLLGGTADIDLVLIHSSEPSQQRETVRLSHQIHLDIIHHSKEVYSKPSELRVHPWLGPALCEPIFLHDPDHFFERAQAGARGQFYRPDHTFARASAFLHRARQGHSLLGYSQRWLKFYLRAVMEAANAVASLDKFPAAGRRLTLDLAKQAEHFEYPAFYEGFLNLLGGDHMLAWNLPDMLSAWARAYDVASQGEHHLRIPAYRRDYYLHAFQAFIENGDPEAILWPLLQSWERVIAALPEVEENEIHFKAWIDFLTRVRLTERDKDQRAHMLGAYIDQNTAWIKAWGIRVGA